VLRNYCARRKRLTAEIVRSKSSGCWLNLERFFVFEDSVEYLQEFP